LGAGICRRAPELIAAYRRLWLIVPLAQRRMICALAVAVLAANLWQPYPEIAPLQHIPTVALLLASPWLLRRWPLSDASVGAVVAFFLLHTLAGRYAYSNVPYDAWGRVLTGGSIDAALGWTRNNFDRLVHLSFGVCAVPPVAEALRRYGGVPLRLSLWFAFLFVCGISALYEIFEWLLTIVLAPGIADDYNGQQGDMWDAQKDMAIAIAGACGSIAWAGRRR
jgi:putative membrane protein